MVMGEYAVLKGATALVMAVNRRLLLDFSAAGSIQAHNHSGLNPHRSAENSTVSPEIALALSLGGKAAQDWNITLDTTSLHDRKGNKLGLGSSAAKAVASTAFALRSTEPNALLPLALRAHRAVAPNGSGADVAACVHGGLIQFTLTSDDASPEVGRVEFPEQLRWRAYFSGRSASTPHLVGAVSRFGDRDPKEYGRDLDALAGASDTFHRGCKMNSPDDCLESVRTHCRVLRHLGEAAGTILVDDALNTVASELPEGAAIKPSGAGGGDVSVLFFNGDVTAEQLDRIAIRRGLEPLDLRADEEGARFE